MRTCSSSAFQLARSEAGTTSRLGLARSRFSGCAAGLAMQQQADDLHRLSQPHVIGQASPEPQARDEREPAHARLLIMPKLGSQTRRMGVARAIRARGACAAFLRARFRRSIRSNPDLVQRTTPCPASWALRQGAASRHRTTGRFLGSHARLSSSVRAPHSACRGRLRPTFP